MSEQSKKMPHSVTIVRYGVFIFGVINFWQASVIDQQIYLWQRWNPSVDPRLRAVGAFLWGWWFIGLGVALWAKRPFTALAIPISILAYTLYALILLAFARSLVAQRGWIGILIVGITAAALAYWGLRPLIHRIPKR